MIRSTIFEDLDGDVDVVFPASAKHVRKVSVAQLLLQGELLFGELPFIHCEVTQVWRVGLFLMETKKSSTGQVVTIERKRSDAQ